MMKKYSLFLFFACLLVTTVKVQAQGSNKLPKPNSNVQPGNYYGNYQFISTKGCITTTFYVGDTIYNTNSAAEPASCKPPSQQTLNRLALLPAAARQIVSPTNETSYWAQVTDPNGNWVSSAKTCQRIGPVHYAWGKYQSFSIQTSGTYTISFVNDSKTVDITIVDRPAISPTVSIGSNAVGNAAPAGKPITFTATIANQGDYTSSYQWYVNNIKAGSINQDLVTSSLNDNDVVNCILSSKIDDCSDLIYDTSQSLTMKIGASCTTSSVTNLSICASQIPFTWNGLVFTDAGTQTATLLNVAGCDSTATLNLTISSGVSTTTVYACTSYTWNGTTYTKPGTYTFNTTNESGCDSVATLVLYFGNVTNNYQVYTPNYNDSTVSVYNSSTNSTSTVGVGKDNLPSSLCLSPDGSKVYVLNSNTYGGLNGTISVIDTRTNTVIANIGAGKYPTSICISPDGSRVYSISYDELNLYVINTATNSVELTQSLGTRGISPMPRFIAISPDGAYLCLAFTEGQTRVYSTATLDLIKTIYVGANNLFFSQNGSQLYIASGNNILVYRVFPNGYIGAPTTIGGFNAAQYLATSADGKTLYVGNTGNNTVSIVNIANQQIVQTISGFSYVAGVGVSPDGSSLFVIDNTIAYNIISTLTGGNRITSNNSKVNIYSTTSYALTNSYTTGKNSFCTNAFISQGSAAIPCSAILTSFNPTTAGTDSTITLLGSDFTGTTSVSIGGVAAKSFSIINDSTITAVVGNATSGSVSVTNANGTVSLSGFTFIACTPNSSTTNHTICSNQLPYAWNGQTITAAGTYQATLTNAGGCDSTATLELTVNSAVTPSVTITSNPTMPIAVGTNVVFAAVPTNGGSGITYAWYKNALKLNDTDSILQSASVEDEDTIKCVITSNAACVTSTTAESNKIVVVEIPVCVTPTKFSITGGGVYCSTGSGLPIGLSSSEVGVNYQLLIPSPKNPNQWGTLNAPIAGTGSAINFGNYTAATYRVLAKTAVGSCQDTMSGIATITSTNMAIWAGNSSNDLNNAANIEGCALSSSVDLDIAAGLSVYPVVTGTVSVKSVNVQAGATLSVSGKLNVSGSFTNNGTPNLGTGSVVLNGTGLLIGYSIFNNLEIAGDYNINKAITTKVEVTGNLKLTSGTFTTIGKLTLKSTASKTALIQENGGSINGSINMERYVGGSTGYHHLSSPVSNNTVATWGKYFNIVGKDGLRSVTKGSVPATLQEYRESANTKPILDSAYYNYTNGDAVTTNGKGLSAWFAKAPTTIVSTGNVTSGTVTVPVTYSATNATTKGWNLIGNPYPSPISWSALRSLNPGVWGDQACYIWKPTRGINGQWQTYNGTVGTNGVGNVIASSQAFFVLVNQSTNLTFNNSIRTTDLSPTFFSTQQHKQLRLQIVNPANLAETDEVVAYSKAGIVQPVASVKPPMPAEATNASLSFVHEGKPAAIEAVADFKAGDELALNISTPVAGVYLLKVGEYNHSIPAYLKDAKTGSYMELKAGTEITIATEATTRNTRYSVVFGRPAAAVVTANNSYKVFAAKKAIQVTNAVAVSNAKVVVYNSLGQQIATATMNGTRLTIPVSASNNATYVVKIAGETVAKVIVP